VTLASEEPTSLLVVLVVFALLCLAGALVVFVVTVKTRSRTPAERKKEDERFDAESD